MQPLYPRSKKILHIRNLSSPALTSLTPTQLAYHAASFAVLPCGFRVQGPGARGNIDILTGRFGGSILGDFPLITLTFHHLPATEPEKLSQASWNWRSSRARCPGLFLFRFGQATQLKPTALAHSAAQQTTPYVWPALESFTSTRGVAWRCRV